MPKNQQNLDDGMLVAFQRLSEEASAAPNRDSWEQALKLEPKNYPKFVWPDEDQLRLKHPNITYGKFAGVYNAAFLKCLGDNIKSLCDAYGIEQSQGNYALLSILLRKYVPGFKPSRGPGASTKWSTIHLLFTYAYVQMKCATNPKLTVSGVCSRFPNRWPRFLAEVLPTTGAIRQSYASAKNSNEVVNYDAEQRGRFGDLWFQDFLDGNLFFDPANTKVTKRLPRLVDGTHASVLRD